MQLLLLVGLALATSLPPKTAPVGTDAAPPPAPALAPSRLGPPPPLPARSFAPPVAQAGQLSNGIPVLLVENHEVPMVNLRIAFRAGSLTDPQGFEGLADATAAMLTQGAGDLDAKAFSREQRKLGSSVGASAGVDGTVLAVSSLTRNLGPTLDLLKLAWKSPSFPETEWETIRQQMVEGVTWRRTDPNAIANHVLDVVQYGVQYRGRAPTEASLAAVSPRAMKRWAKRWLVPEQAVILVGGDTTLPEILPLLEARFGSIRVKGRNFAPSVTVHTSTGSTLTLVDKPGATQSVILAARPVGSPTDPDYASLVLANSAIGGMFTSRLNMNLREEKGYTYGVRSSVGWNLAGAQWTLSAPVQSDKTVAALKEILTELGAPANSEPITAAELEEGRGSIVNSYPLKFEEPGWLLGQHEAVWRYSLGPEWIPGYLDRLSAVTPTSTQEAWVKRIGTQGISFVVVGDALTLREQLKSVGLPIRELDVDGKPLQVVAPTNLTAQ